MPMRAWVLPTSSTTAGYQPSISRAISSAFSAGRHFASSPSTSSGSFSPVPRHTPLRRSNFSSPARRARAAAQTYFNKPLEALLPEEAAYLAALPKAPLK